MYSYCILSVRAVLRWGVLRFKRRENKLHFSMAEKHRHTGAKELYVSSLEAMYHGRVTGSFINFSQEYCKDRRHPVFVFHSFIHFQLFREYLLCVRLCSSLDIMAKKKKRQNLCVDENKNSLVVGK